MKLLCHRLGADTGNEGDVIGPCLEEIMTLAAIADIMRQFHAEKIAVGANNLLNIACSKISKTMFYQLDKII